MSESDPIAQLNTSLSGRYAIERELGRGGMATVYLAEDVKHSRRVAIKVLRPDLSAAVGAERFLREINLTARLTHPRIVAIYDSGSVGELLYYVMPFVDGESLRDRLARDGQLPVDDAVAIATTVAAALSYAHAHGVVHRDIKPENILLADGEVIVADFGIGRAIAATGEERLTQTGLSLGTPAYMSPEQAAGDANIDARSDVFALGCVTYEMLVGEPPFRGPTIQAIVARLVSQPMPSIREVRGAVSVAVENTVRKALEKTPADRFPTAAAFSEALRKAAAEPVTAERGALRRGRPWWWIGAAAVVVASVAGVRYWFQPPAPHSIAILALRTVGGDSAFSDGMAEEVTATLQGIAGLTVSPAASAFYFKNKPMSAQAIGKRLGVEYVATGLVQTGGTRRRVEVQLISVASGSETWHQAYESDLGANDPFAVQDSIARAVVTELRVHLSANAAPARRSTESTPAHDLYMQGRFFVEKRDPASLKKAQSYFEQAIRIDSSYAQAYAGLSSSYAFLAVLATGPGLNQLHASAKKAAEKALALDPDLAEAHAALGFVLLFFDWNAAAARSQFDTALILHPSDAPTHLYRAIYFQAVGSADSSVNEAKEAIRLEQFSLITNTRLATFYSSARDFRAALEQAYRVADLDSTFWQWPYEAALAYVRLGQCDSAVALANWHGRRWAGNREWVLGSCGRRADVLAEMGRAGWIDSLPHEGRARMYAGLGDKEKAFAQLDSAIAAREWRLILLKLEPEYDDLHSDPRFARLVQRIGVAR